MRVTDVPGAGPGLLASALGVADLGWHVFPCVPGAKRPALRQNWQDLATTDPGRIRTWWTRQPYNVGIACGPSGLVVVDLDIARDEDRILTSHAGSLPRPADLIALNQQRAAGNLPDEAEYLRELRAAVADVVARQRATGIDLINDGEYAVPGAWPASALPAGT